MLIEIYSLDGKEIVITLKDGNCLTVLKEYLKKNENRKIRVSSDIDINTLLEISLDLPTVDILTQISSLEMFSYYSDSEDLLILNSNSEFTLIILDKNDAVSLLCKNDCYTYLEENKSSLSFELTNGWTGDGLEAQLLHYKDANGKTLNAMRLADTSIGKILCFELTSKDITPAAVVKNLFDNHNSFCINYSLNEVIQSDYFRFTIINNLELEVINKQEQTFLSDINDLTEYLKSNSMNKEIVSLIETIGLTEPNCELQECNLENYWLKATIMHEELEDLLEELLFL